MVQTLARLGAAWMLLAGTVLLAVGLGLAAAPDLPSSSRWDAPIPADEGPPAQNRGTITLETLR